MSSNDSGFPLEIPNELYGLILDFVCDENFLQEHPWLDHHPDNEPFTEVSSSPLRDLPALVISAVCTRWRSIALSSPAFWSKLRLELLFTDASTMSKGLASTLELYLQRSNHCPLYIDLNITGKLRNDSAVIPLASLTRCAQFWKSFRYRGDFRSLIHLQNFSQLHFPILENLDVRATGMVAGDLFTCFQNAPSLCAITATAKPGFFEAAELPLRHRLTSLDLIISSHVQEQTFMNEVLDLCPNLTTMKLWQFACNRYANSASPPHTSSSDKLRSLTLAVGEVRRANFMAAVFSNHTLPSLTELHIKGTYYDYCADFDVIWPKLSFDGFISRSSCSITSFSIHGMGISDSEVIGILLLLSSLLDLSLDDNMKQKNSPITSHFISTLHLGSGSTNERSSSIPLLPKLCRLSLYVGGTSFDDAAFVSMVSSRWLPDPNYAEIVGVSCLRSVVLGFRDRKVDEEIYEPLKHLVKMDVVITGLE